ncbi:MAG: hypothetical protein ACR2IJ_06000 [Fluviibacter sp.]
MSCQFLSADIVSLIAAVVALIISEALALSKNGRYNGILQVALDFALGAMRARPTQGIVAGAVVAGTEAVAAEATSSHTDEE